MKQSIQFRFLPIRNLQRKPGRAWALILLTAFLSLSLFGGSAVVLSLRNGLGSLEGRLGADIIVVPSTAKSKVNLENMLLQGTTGAFYMDAQRLTDVRNTPGVEKAAAQVFLSSLKADCCSSKVQVIGIDQTDDFTVQPWIQESSAESMGFMDVVVGCNISADVGDMIRLYNNNCPVRARLSQTGTGLDTAVYCSLETMNALLASAEEAGVSHKVNTSNSGQVISAIYVKVRDDMSVEQVANELNSHPLWKVSAVQTRSMITDVSDGLAGISKTILVLVVIVWILSFIILLIAYTMVMNERKREFAVLRMLGTSRKMLSKLALREALLASAIGALLGIVAGAVLLFSFSGLLETRLGLPFLTPGVPTILLLAALSLFGTTAMGALASAHSAYRLSRVDTGSILREGN